MQYSLTYPTGIVHYLFGEQLSSLAARYKPGECIVITDEHISSLYASLLAPYKTIILPPGEDQKNWQTIEHIAQQLIDAEAHRKTMLIGIGGGVVTDITGFVASVYMRGIPFGFVPTSLLGMVDAAVGGKNGVSLGLHKNILGTINQPQFLLFDASLLKTLPDGEWSNGFAEIIKYACLFDAPLFEELKENDIHHYQHNQQALEELIARCVAWKNKTVLADEKESGPRKLLNLGHTAGHALENLYHLLHGHAVAIGMVIACLISEQVCGLDTSVRHELSALLKKYKLPVTINFDIEKVLTLLKMDKKRNTDTVDYVLLNSIGNAIVKPLPFEVINDVLNQFAHAGSY